jgi:hypothetical protein
MKKTAKSNIPGMILSAAGFIYLLALSSYMIDYRELFFDKYDYYEKKAFENLKDIISAQTEYKKRDYDGDGILNYAVFTPHLWISVDQQNNQVPVNLLEADLALAMCRIDSHKGYVYEMLHKKKKSDGSEEFIDFENEWAIVAYPVFEGFETGVTFITSHTGKIFAKSNYHEIDSYPFDLLEEAWTEINRKIELKKLRED